MVADENCENSDSVQPGLNKAFEYAFEVLDELENSGIKINQIPPDFFDKLSHNYLLLKNCLYSTLISSIVSSTKLNLEHKRIITDKEKGGNLSNFISKWGKRASSDDDLLTDKDYKHFERDVDTLFLVKITGNDKPGLSEIKKAIEKGINISLYKRKIDDYRDRLNNYFRRVGKPKYVIIDSSVSSIKPLDFEEYVARLFRLMGYDSEVTVSTGDYGIDVIAENQNEVIAIQCKKYSENNKVGNREVQMFLGAIQRGDLGADRGIIITTSSFTRQAIKQADGTRVELWDSNDLQRVSNSHLAKGLAEV